MFLQILMLTRQNKCHAAYFFNTRVSPNGFLCSGVDSVMFGVIVRKAELGRFIVSLQRGDLPEGLARTSSTWDRWSHWKSRAAWVRLWLYCLLGPQESHCNFLGPDAPRGAN